jgi:hypothetical protein
MTGLAGTAGLAWLPANNISNNTGPGSHISRRLSWYRTKDAVFLRHRPQGKEKVANHCRSISRPFHDLHFVQKKSG